MFLLERALLDSLLVVLTRFAEIVHEFQQMFQ